MQITQFAKWAMAVTLAAGMTGAVAHADGTDPQGRWQAPGNGGTPGVGNEFSLPAFPTTGTIGPIDNTGCIAGEDASGNETLDCTLKNQSNNNWTEATITSSDAVPCSDVMVSTNMFLNAGCMQNAAGDAVLAFSGVQYSASNLTFLGLAPASLDGCNPSADPDCNVTYVQTGLLQPGPAGQPSPFIGNCSPSAGSVPGVPIGCDFEIILGAGPDGDWPAGTSFSVIAPEPSTVALLLIGLASLPFVIRRRKLI